MSSDKSGNRRILYVDVRGKRQAIRLGKVSKKQAQATCVRIEALIDGRQLGQSPPAEVTQWVLGVDERLRERLRTLDLINETVGVSRHLGGLLAAFFDHASVKPTTRVTYRQTETALLAFFDAGRVLASISPHECELWKQSMISADLAPSTVSKRVKTARQMFERAVRWRWIDRNPLADVIAGGQVNRDRQRYISRGDIDQVVASC